MKVQPPPGLFDDLAKQASGVPPGASLPGVQHVVALLNFGRRGGCVRVEFDLPARREMTLEELQEHLDKVYGKPVGPAARDGAATAGEPCGFDGGLDAGSRPRVTPVAAAAPACKSPAPAPEPVTRAATRRTVPAERG